MMYENTKVIIGTTQKLVEGRGERVQEGELTSKARSGVEGYGAT